MVNLETNNCLSFLAGFLNFKCGSRAAENETNQPSFNPCRRFSIAEIKAATNNFDNSLIIGNGGFGNVYKGHIDKGTVTVAIKRLRAGSDQGDREFRTEITMLSRFRHPHLVSLIGYCTDGGEMILVYDFMARGTLRDHLYGPNRDQLSWNQRLEICLAAARGLQFLHAGGNIGSDSKQSVIHRDVKSTNILLDEKWVAKVSDFGLSKVGPYGSHVTTEVKGSFGYLDPEYYLSLWLTEKSDVYSFGVVMLEVLCGRPPCLANQESLVKWVKMCHDEKKLDLTVDLALRDSIREKCLKKFVGLALSCVRDHGKERPLMRDVVKGLERALKLQQSGGQGGAQLVHGKGKTSADGEMAIMGMSKHKFVSDDNDEEIVEEFRRVNHDVSGSSKGTNTTTATNTTAATTSSEEEQSLVQGIGVTSELATSPRAR